MIYERNFRIIVVDDDSIITKVLADTLGDMGYDVAVANNGHSAIDMVKRTDYDVALVDVVMPGINGLETFKEVRRISPSMKVMMMTAYCVDNIVEEALTEGAYGVLYKPLDLDKVAHFIEKAKKMSFPIDDKMSMKSE
jgi:DNA-binding NtrC family response regulator